MSQEPASVIVQATTTGESGNGTSAKVGDGVYFYLDEVEFADFANTKRTYKGWVEIIR